LRGSQTVKLWLRWRLLVYFTAASQPNLDCWTCCWEICENRWTLWLWARREFFARRDNL